MSTRLTIRAPEVAQVAAILRPEARRLTTNDLNCALLLLLFKADVGSDPGEDVYTPTRAASLLHPEYDDVGSRGKQGFREEVMGYGIRLADMSANTRGESAIGVVMFTEETYKIWKNGEATVASVVKSYRPGLPYTRIGVFGNLNGEYIAGWAAFQKRKGRGLEAANARRVDGWDAGGLLTEGTKTQHRQLTGGQITEPQKQLS